MFICRLAGPTGPWECHIEGCPASGLDAIDFRRAHGLTDATSNRIVMPAYEWVDEELVREGRRYADEHANLINPSAWMWVLSPVGVGGGEDFRRLQESLSGTVWVDNISYSTRLLTLPPGLIIAYKEEQTPETGRAIFRSVWLIERRSRARMLSSRFHGLATEEHRARALQWLTGTTTPSGLYISEDETPAEILAEACLLTDAITEGVDPRTGSPLTS